MEWARKLFGLDREEIWRKLAKRVGGRFVEGGWASSDEVRLEHGPWIVVLDTYFNAATKTRWTRLRSFCANPGGLRFTVTRTGLLTDIAKRLGMQDLEVGQPAFDRDFVIQGNDPRALRKLFAGERLRSLLEAQPKVQFNLHPARGGWHRRFARGTSELVFQVHGLLRDVERLEQLFDLMAETLERLALPAPRPRRDLAS